MYRALITIFMALNLAIVSSLANAGEKIDKSLTVEPNGLVEIHNVRGEVNVIGWETSQIKVTGVLDDLAERFIFTTENGYTQIKVELPRNSFHRSSEGSDLKVMVPIGSKVSFSGVATDLDISGVDGGVDINSVSGDIDLNQVNGRTYINNVSGELKLKALKGSLEVSTVSGQVDASVECDQVKVSGISADIKLNLKEFASANLSSVSGDTQITGVLVKHGEINLKTVSGDAIFMVDGKLNARISLETAPGGEITNNYSDDKPQSNFIKSQNLEFTAGEGDGVIRMSTVSGNVGLKKER